MFELATEAAETVTTGDFEIFGMPVQLGTMLFQLGAFIILFILLSMFAFKPLMRMMKQRQEHIENELRNAESHRTESERLIKEQREAIVAARQEAHTIIERAKGISEKEAASILEAARKEAERVRDQAIADIALEREHAINALKEEVSKISLAIATKIIEKELDETTNRKLVEEYMSQVGGLQ